MKGNYLNIFAKLLILLFALLLPFENVLKFILLPGMGPVTIHQVIGVVLIPLVIFGKNTSIPRRVVLPILVLFSVLVYGISVDFLSTKGSGFGVAFTYLQLYFVFLVFIFYFSGDVKLFELFVWAFSVGIVFACGLALCGFGISNGAYIGDRPRIMGEDPNNLAGSIAIVIAYFLYRALDCRRIRGEVKYIVLISIFISLIVWLQSRTVMIAIVAQVLLWSVFKIKNHKNIKSLVSVLLILSCIGFVFYIVASESLYVRIEKSILFGDTAGRDNILATYTRMISERPIEGWGWFGAFEEAGHRLGYVLDTGDFGRSSHNIYITIMSSVGVFGFLAFLSTSFFLLRSAVRFAADRQKYFIAIVVVGVMLINLGLSWDKYKLLWILSAYLVSCACMNGVKGRSCDLMGMRGE